MTALLAKRRHEADFPDTVAEEPAALELAGDAPPDHRPLDTLPTIGHIGRYALKHRLGEGGLGTVYAAIDPLLSRPVAVKTLHVDPSSGADAEAQLLHEARAVAALSHPHIVTVHDAGVSGDDVYLAMEKLDGRDLRQLLARGWRPKVRQAALIVRRIAEALAYAHGKGVIHCDVKPANIFMVGRTSPKVLDFGIARVRQRPDSDSRALAGGSPYYMAPEQVRGEPVDRRCDVYSLGVVLYELLTGRRAFAGATLDEITDAVLHRVPAPAHKVNPRVPAALSAIAARAMAKDVGERHRSARELARELRTWLGEELPRRRRRRSRVPLAVAAVVAVFVAGGVGFAVSNALDDDTRADAAAPSAASARGVTASPSAASARAVVTSPAPDAPGAGAWHPEAARVLRDAAQTDAALAGDAPPSDPRSGHATLPGDTLPTAQAGTPVPAAPIVPTATTSGARRPGDTPDVFAAGPAGSKATPPKRTRPRDKPAARPAPAAPAPEGTVQLAVSPWGEVEVDGAAAGVSPPLTRLSLPAGTHTIVIRNADFAPHRATVHVSPDLPVTVRHRFGS